MFQIGSRFRSFKTRYQEHVRKFGEASFLGYAVAVIPRLLFILHAVFSIRLLEKYTKHEVIRTNDEEILVATQIPMLPLYTGLALLGLESLYTIITRRGHEYKHIWFSGFLYLVTEIPVICCLEYAFFQMRKQYSEAVVAANNTNAVGTITKPPYNPDTYLNCFHLALEFNCSDQFIRKFAELGLISVVIIGRWMLPRGELTRDQLSALLIGYVNTAADLTEFVGLLTKTEINEEQTVVTVVLAIYGLSLLQFVIVTTSTTYEYSETEKEAISSLTRNLPQNRMQSYLHPKEAKMGKTAMSRSVDALAEDVFRSGQRAGRRRRAVMPGKRFRGRVNSIENGSLQKMNGANGNRNVANETIHEEPGENDTAFTTQKQIDRKDIGHTIEKATDNGNVISKQESIEIDRKDKSHRSVTLAKWQSSLHVSLRLESVRRSLTEKNWKQLSETLMAMKMKKKRDEEQANASFFETELKDYPPEVLHKEEEEVDDSNSWNHWIEVVQTEMGGLLIALFLQEIPFFFTRVAFMYKYSLFDRGLIFYTIKNFFMLSFLNYRLWVATTEE